MPSEIGLMALLRQLGTQAEFSPRAVVVGLRDRGSGAHLVAAFGQREPDPRCEPALARTWGHGEEFIAANEIGSTQAECPIGWCRGEHSKASANN